MKTSFATALIFLALSSADAAIRGKTKQQEQQRKLDESASMRTMKTPPADMGMERLKHR